jgi:hypothetical protein
MPALGGLGVNSMLRELRGVLGLAVLVAVATGAVATGAVAGAIVPGRRGTDAATAPAAVVGWT